MYVNRSWEFLNPRNVRVFTHALFLQQKSSAERANELCITRKHLNEAHISCYPENNQRNEQEWRGRGLGLWISWTHQSQPGITSNKEHMRLQKEQFRSHELSQLTWSYLCSSAMCLKPFITFGSVWCGIVAYRTDAISLVWWTVNHKSSCEMGRNSFVAWIGGSWSLMMWSI